MNATPMFAAALIVLSTSGAGAAQPIREARPIAPSSTAACGDLLMAIGRKPPDLKYLGCRSEKVHGFAALIADYRVEGRDAEAIERHFVRFANMPAVRFACCGWETPGPGGQLRHSEVAYDVSMASGETLLNQRADWPRISWFRVTVTRYLEEP